MPTLATLIASYTRKPTASVALDGKPWRAVTKLRITQAFGSGISGGTVEGRAPPVTPRIGMSISWKWGYNGQHVAGFTGEVSDIVDTSYPNRWSIEVKDVLWRADKASQVIVTDPLNEIVASDAIRYILTHYGGISSGRIAIPALSASGSEWAGSEWTLGILTPVAWGDTETNSGGTTALKACQEICSCLGYWLYADSGGTVRAKQMERKPSSSAFRTFQRGVDLLVSGAPERRQSYDSIYNRVIVQGGNTGVEGAQIMDAFQTSHPLLPSGVYREYTFSSFLIEYVNPSQAGAASATSIATRILSVMSRTPNIIRARVKADPRLSVGTTIGIVDSGLSISTSQHFFIYALETSLDLVTGAFDQQLTLDGGTGSGGYTTIPNPDAAFSWRLMSEGLNGDSVIEVFLDGSGSVSLAEGEIVSWDWSTSTTTYGGTPDTASGVNAVFLFPASAGTAEITLTVTDTTSKTGTLMQTVDLTGADTLTPIQRVLSVALGAAWQITQDGGVSWATETTNGDAVAVPPYGAGIDDRAGSDSVTTYGLLATRGSAGVGVRQTLDALATPSTNLASIGTAIRCMWVNEANPARVWVGAGDTVYRSTNGGSSFTAMAKPDAGTDINWIIEDPALDDSVFVACGADLFNATAPTIGWATLYEGPGGATARQFVRSRDGQVTWVCYTGAPSGEACQRVETGAAADVAVTDIRTIALDKDATADVATLYLIDADDPAKLYTVDGLTGLSAATLTPTLPAGATAQHMMADPDVDVFYIADFDSVAVGTGAVRKLIADQLFLMRAGSTGQQAHMLGFGGKSLPPAELLMITSGVSPGGVYHYTNAWTLRNNGLPTGKYWRWIAASPGNPDHWLLLGNHGSITANYTVTAGNFTMSDGTHPLWMTLDAGLTWTAVPLPATSPTTAGYMGSVEWRADTGEAWSLDAGTTGGHITIWRGTLGTATEYRTNITSSVSLGGFGVPGVDNEVIAANDFIEGYLPATGTTFTVVESSPAWTGNLVMDRFVSGTGRGLLGVASSGVNSGRLYGADDYRVDTPDEILTGAGVWCSASIDSLYAGGRVASGTGTGGVYKVSDPLGSASGAIDTADNTNIGFIRVDRQTRTHVAALNQDLNSIIVSDGAVWGTSVLYPADPSDLSDRVEILVRP